MLYLSQLLGTPVEDGRATRIGKITDMLGTRFIAPSPAPGAASVQVPAAASILVIEGQADQLWYVPAGSVEWHDDILRLRIPVEQLATQPPVGDELNTPVSLAHEVLDKQVIDLARKKAVRVNDVCLADDWRILGIDSSTLGLVRRLAPNWLLGSRRGQVNQAQRPPTNLIPWNQIALIDSQQPEPAEVPEVSQTVEAFREGLPEGLLPTRPIRTQSGQLAELHPADIADIMHQLTPGQGARILEGLDDETAAAALEEVDTESQGDILENISPARAASILNTMGPDEAADLIARLPEEFAQQLLRLMKPEESEDVQELLTYEENSAGGLMTTDYIALTATKSATEALEAVRTSIREQDVAHPTYIYCVADDSEDESVLLGVVSLWELLVAAPAQSLQELMETDVITVQPDTEPREVAEIMAKYNLLAVPVVNAQGMLEGIVTVDDALDVLLPNERRRKPTKMY